MAADLQAVRGLAHLTGLVLFEGIRPNRSHVAIEKRVQIDADLALEFRAEVLVAEFLAQLRDLGVRQRVSNTGPRYQPNP
jgi:hypothetical protein